MNPTIHRPFYSARQLHLAALHAGIFSGSLREYMRHLRHPSHQSRELMDKSYQELALRNVPSRRLSQTPIQTAPGDGFLKWPEAQASPLPRSASRSLRQALRALGHRIQRAALAALHQWKTDSPVRYPKAQGALPPIPSASPSVVPIEKGRPSLERDEAQS